MPILHHYILNVVSIYQDDEIMVCIIGITYTYLHKNWEETAQVMEKVVIWALKMSKKIEKYAIILILIYLSSPCKYRNPLS